MNQKPTLYEVIKQKPFCCVPASLQMVLVRRNLDSLNQEDIGYALGLSVPSEYINQFPKARRHRPSSGYGTEIQNENYSLNKFFKDFKIELQEEYFFLDKVDNPKKFVQKNLENGNDIIVCFNHKKLYGDGDWGHVSLLESIENDSVILVDPERNTADRKKVKLNNLIQAMKIHGKDNRAGFWIISK